MARTKTTRTTKTKTTRKYTRRNTTSPNCVTLAMPKNPVAAFKFGYALGSCATK